MRSRSNFLTPNVEAVRPDAAGGRSEPAPGWASCWIRVDCRCSPRVAANEALRLVHAKERATFRARPLGGFFGDKTLDSNSLDVLEISDGAHAVPSLVAGIKMQQFGAGKFVAGRTELMATGGQRLAVLYGTSKARV